MASMRALGFISDLFFRSKLDAVAAAAGAEMVYASSLDQARERCADRAPSVIFADLSDAAFPASAIVEAMRAAAPGARLIGFASHVDLRPLRAAREAGFDLTLSRQEFSARLGEFLRG